MQQATKTRNAELMGGKNRIWVENFANLLRMQDPLVMWSRQDVHKTAGFRGQPASKLGQL